MNQGWLSSWNVPPPPPPRKDPVIEIESPPLKRDKKITAKTLHQKISVTTVNVGQKDTRRKSARLQKLIEVESQEKN